METHRLYDGFAPFYNQYWGDYFLDDARDGIADAFLPLVRRGGKILDLCCGTGQTAAWLAACGFDVIGVDSSPAMLRFAAENAPAAEFHCIDARSFQLDEPVDAALSTFDSLNHFATIAEVDQVFGCVYRALRPGGWFLFDFNTDEGFAYNAGESYSVCNDDHALVVRSDYDEEAGRGVSRITLFTPAPGGLWSRRDLEIPEYRHPTDALEASLTNAGFEGLRSFDATADFEMPKAEGRFFLLAQRPE